MRVLLFNLLLLALISAFELPAMADDSVLCRAATATVETNAHIPDAFLSAIARVETGRPDGSGGLEPWPWTINAEGAGAFFDTKAQAITAIKALQARGVRSIDVGCMQVNLMHHPEAFSSLDQALDPDANAAYAGRFLTNLFVQTGSWPLAAAAYHSLTPPIGAAYQRRVLAEWAVPDDRPTRSRRATSPSKGLSRDDPALAVLRVHAEPAPPPQASAAIRPTQAMFAHGGNAPASHANVIATRAPIEAVGFAATGRNLAAYRMMPTALAFRAPQRPG